MSEENGHLYERAIHELLRFRYPVHNIVDASGLGHVLHMLDQYRLSLWYRLRKRRPLLKDPKGVLSAEWLNQRFDIQPVVMIRHPAAFVSSIKRLGWSFDFRNWYDQPLLMRDLLGEYRAPIKDLSEKPRDIIEQGILIWNVLHRVIDGFRHRHPDWIFLRHEDLSEEPLEGFRDLYKRLDLTWDDVVEDAIIRSSTDKRRKEVPTYLAATVIRDSRAARWTWTSRLTKKEQNRVREGTADVARLFYTDEDWTPPTEFR